jgi:hypothetical protein
MKQELFENLVMNKLLDDENSIFSKLKVQYMNAKVKKREFTEYGFFVHYTIPKKLYIGKISGDIHDVTAVFPNSKELYIFRLTINNGAIDALEGFSMINEWKYCYDDAILEYAYDDGRHYDIKY